MAVFERNGRWYYEFIYDGQRIRESAKTTRETVAKEAEKQRRRELEQGRAGMPSVEDKQRRSQTVSRALDLYLKSYAVDHRENSILTRTQRSVPLKRLLGNLIPRDLSEARIQRYRAARRAEGASNNTINAETTTLCLALGRTFKTMWPSIRRLEGTPTIGRALSVDEERRIFDAAAKSTSRVIYPIVRIAFAGGLRRDEIRLLMWSQIDFDKREITVGRAKTAAGQGRVIPFDQNLAAVLDVYRARYVKRFGPTKPEWFVFPGKRKRAEPVIPTMAIRDIKTAWKAVRKAAGVKCRLHDARHTLCSRLAEIGVPESTMLSIMGHMNRTMLERYSHTRMESKREAIAAVGARSAAAIPPNVVPPNAPPQNKTTDTIN